MEPYAWLALLALLIALTVIYFLLRQDREGSIVNRPGVDSEIASEIQPQLDPHLVPAEGEAWLPQTYGEGHLALMVRDPHCLYAYWELAPQGLSQEERSRLYLRLLKTDEQVCQDYSVDELVGSWYFHQVTPSSRFVVSLGCLHPDHRYQELMRSQPVMTPPEGPSSVVVGDYIPGLWEGEVLPSSPMWWQGGRQ